MEVNLARFFGWHYEAWGNLNMGISEASDMKDADRVYSRLETGRNFGITIANSSAQRGIMVYALTARQRVV
jgi:hypothetical protein